MTQRLRKLTIHLVFSPVRKGCDAFNYTSPRFQPLPPPRPPGGQGLPKRVNGQCSGSGGKEGGEVLPRVRRVLHTWKDGGRFTVTSASTLFPSGSKLTHKTWFWERKTNTCLQFRHEMFEKDPLPAHLTLVMRAEVMKKKGWWKANQRHGPTCQAGEAHPHGKCIWKCVSTLAGPPAIYTEQTLSWSSCTLTATSCEPPVSTLVLAIITSDGDPSTVCP